MTTTAFAITGTVRWINYAKGFGVITPDAGGKDLFADIPVHKGTVIPGGLKIKQKVSYEVRQSAEGDLAVNVRAIG